MRSFSCHAQGYSPSNSPSQRRKFLGHLRFSVFLFLPLIFQQAVAREALCGQRRSTLQPTAVPRVSKKRASHRTDALLFRRRLPAMEPSPTVFFVCQHAWQPENKKNKYDTLQNLDTPRLCARSEHVDAARHTAKIRCRRISSADIFGRNSTSSSSSFSDILTLFSCSTRNNSSVCLIRRLV